MRAEERGKVCTTIFPLEHAIFADIATYSHKWYIGAFNEEDSVASWTDRIAELFAAHRSKLETTLARRTGNRDLAGELVQEAFVRLLASGAPSPSRSVEEDTRLLYAIARNAAIDHGRITQRRAELLGSLSPEQFPTEAPSPGRELDAKRAMTAMIAALESLPQRTQDVFLLRRVDGLSHAEIADKLDISVSTVEKHLLRALRHCQSRLRLHLDD